MSGAGVIAFDLDGTLVDSVEGIHASLVAACQALGLEAPSQERLRCHIGPPLSQYLPRLLKLEQHHAESLVQQVVQQFRHHHDREGWRLYSLYEGVPELLEQLTEAGWSLHVVSHKPFPLAEQLLKQEGLDLRFASLQAPGSHGWQNKSTALKHLMRQETMPPSHWYVGDTASDHEAATQASFSFAAADYGYGLCAQADARITAPSQLLEVLR
jgi:phosphoglycolate phosphatase-like HAD superfamily hydrolase